MDTQEFLKKILPEGGYKILAELVPYLDKHSGETRAGWKYQKFTSFGAMAEAAAQLDAAGRTVYHACNAYGDWYEEEVKGKTKRRIRTQANVTHCRSLYDDIDIGKKDCYATKSEAVADLKKFLAATGLPVPMLVSSGSGLHLYWPLEVDITPEEWKRLANLKRAVTDHFGLKVDHAVDTDTARVLRPIGTTNHKHNKKVSLLVDSPEVYTVERIESALAAYAEANTVLVPKVREKIDQSAMPAWAQDVEYPPSSGMEIIRKCGAMRQVAKAKGDVVEPLWRAMLGLVKHTVEADALAHLLSQGSPSYDYDTTQEKIDNWALGPSTCNEFSKHTEACKGCKYNGKIKSPIKLGYSEELVDNTVQIEVPVEEDKPDVVIDSPTTEVELPDGLRWDGHFLSKFVRNTDGDGEWQRFCQTLFYASLRIRSPDGTWALRVHAQERNGKWRSFDVPTVDVSSPDTLGKTLAQYEVFAEGSKNARYHMQDAMRTYVAALQEGRIEVRTYSGFGWDDEGGFVIGSKRVTAKGMDDVLLTDTIIPENRKDFGVSGTVEEWTEHMNTLLNRPGAEPYQFVLCAALAAPLIHLLPNSQNWHGIPVALTGGSGLGKSTMCTTMCSVFGKWEHFKFNAGSDGATANALNASVAMMRNLPLVMDEITGRKFTEIGEMLYSLSNGHPKRRLGQSGKFVGEGVNWNTVSFITSNISINDELSKLDVSRVDATKLRVFEIALPDDYNSRVFSDVNAKDLVENKLGGQYGVVGREYLRWVLNNREWVGKQMEKLRAKFNPRNQEETRERYYMDLIITAMVAGAIAEKMGFIKFSTRKTMKWALDHVLSLRVSRKASSMDTETYVAQYLTDLNGRLIITKRIGDRRSGGVEAMQVEPRGQISGRLALEDKRMYVSVKSITDWCTEHKVSPSALRKEMDRLGYLVFDASGTAERKFRLGRGTNIVSGNTRCLELDFNKVMDGVSLRVVEPETMDEEVAV